MGKKSEEKQRKKLEREKQRSEEIEQTKKEIEELLNNINELTGGDQKIRMVDIKMPTKKERVRDSIIKNVLSFVLILAISGFINWLYYDSLWAVLGFSASIVAVEYILSFIVIFFFGKYLIYSFGTLNVLPPILAFVIVAVSFPFVELVNVWLFIVVMLLYVVVRKMMLNSLNSKGFRLRR